MTAQLYRKHDVAKELSMRLERLSKNITYTLGILAAKIAKNPDKSPLKGVYHKFQDALVYNEKLREFLLRDEGYKYLRVEELSYPIYDPVFTMLQVRSSIHSSFNECRFNFDLLSELLDQGTPERALYARSMRCLSDAKKEIDILLQHVV
jgi:hypothetical protein